MAIAVVYEFAGATREQYDQVLPLTAGVGISSPPKINYFEVHNYLTAGQ